MTTKEISKIKVAVLMPTRGDRPQMLEQAIHYYEQQDYPNKVLVLMADDPINDEPDITYRYKTGARRVFDIQDIDLCVIMEDDDYYAKDYISTMVDEWLNAGKPSLIGYDNTIYYHLGIRKYKLLKHLHHSSMFCTAFTKDVLDIFWPKDTESFLDLHLWKYMSIYYKTHLMNGYGKCMGIKGHKEGSLFGGKGHTVINMYTINDAHNGFLSDFTGEDFKFYEAMIGK